MAGLGLRPEPEEVMAGVSKDPGSMADTIPRAKVAAGEPLYIIVGDVNGRRSATWRIGLGVTSQSFTSSPDR